MWVSTCQISVHVARAKSYTAGTTMYGDSLYGNLDDIPICYVELGI